ncbi:ABC transporter ATP-binding protein [Amnibacterium flavum]|uniref:Heme ABC transporter ATP-binding protein n=1 Tax=Amnibacterium flavum TaxID=2173173 RepID=A0A2V1HPL5_9MICO|nr:ATP-binding cassette domain-containing protein [Amnibacterium flavum]PVZ93552.1 heme ABC transporter ATP-binding protein [Amnibacterium flavum]
MITTPSETGRVLAARSVSKSYGSVRALDDVDIVVAPGRVHAIVGENGAGKSTLAKILAGIELPSAGTMTLGESSYAPRDRADARAAGITMVPQQLSLVGELSLVENLLLTGTRAVVSRRAARETLVDTLLRAGVSVSLDAPTASLSQAHRQLGEIVVALAEGARTLILDEPTASLGPLEVGGLFEHLRGLRELGTAIVLITHRLDEVRQVADDVTVLSHGADVHTGSAVGLEPRRIAQLMVGELPEAPEHSARSVGQAVLRADRVSTDETSDASLRDVSIEVRASEIVGVAGVAGSGQNALLDVLAGFTRPRTGTVTVDGESGSAVELLRNGVAWIPEERSEATVPGMSIGENLAVYDSARGRATRGSARGGTRRVAQKETLTAFDVRPAVPALAASGLSGGNQQKLLVARELGAAWETADGEQRHPRAVLAYGPTQGLDLRASAAIRERLIDLAERGAAVLVASHDLEEILAVADRVVVMFGGRIVADLPVSEATTQRLGEAMAGITSADQPDPSGTPATDTKEPS